jgi:asparagine synthase (glutamine-hydrolysing)
MDVDVVNPFLHPEVLTEIVKAAGRHGFPNRATAMHRICGDRLPYEVITRPDKATFGGALWGPATRAFAKSWDGAGVEPELVDREALRREWLSAEPDFRTALLLHSAWLGSQAIPAS